MLTGIQDISETELLQWIRSNQETGANILSRGYQGYVYLYEESKRRLIIKTPMGWGLGRLIRLWMLRNEYKAYTRLSGVQGVPRCFGLLDGRYLVLEYIEGIPIRKAQITHRPFFFETLLKVIEDLHHAGVAHTDLKKKDNLLVVEGRKPYVIDFGVAVVRKSRFAPLNRYLYHIASTFDFNAWVKLKYDGNYANLTPEDKEYFNRTVIEKVSRWIKDHYLILKKALVGKRPRS
jgi:predicted Ser/Thr protein kinase